MYSARVLDHYRHPRNVGEIENATALVEMTNPVCGDLLKLWAVVRDGRIAEVKFKCAGCIPAVACASWLTEQIAGRPVTEIPTLDAAQIEQGLEGLPQASRHAAVLAADALRALLKRLTS